MINGKSLKYIVYMKVCFNNGEVIVGGDKNVFKEVKLIYWLSEVLVKVCLLFDGVYFWCVYDLMCI